LHKHAITSLPSIRTQILHRKTEHIHKHKKIQSLQTQL